MQNDENNFESALKVNDGIPQPSSVNEDLVRKLKARRKPQLTVEQYLDGILSKNRVILSQAITMIESALPKHQEVAQQIIEKALPHAGKSIRVGITGVPGVGKSTFIEALGKYLTSKGHRLAVLAIDPSSERSKGSILGDKTRMEELSADENAFIRPSPSAGSLGGVARKTRESIVLCEAAGFDVIIVETVGVGQSETAAHSMVDFFLLLQLANAGDELQGIKRGIMEMADAIAINKAEGDNMPKARLAQAQYKNALHLFPPAESGWIPKVETCSALTGMGIDTLWSMVEEFRDFTKANGYFEHQRQQQMLKILTQAIEESLNNRFYQHPEIEKLLEVYRKDVLENKISAYIAAQQLIDTYYSKFKS